VFLLMSLLLDRDPARPLPRPVGAACWLFIVATIVRVVGVTVSAQQQHLGRSEYVSEIAPAAIAVVTGVLTIAYVQRLARGSRVARIVLIIITVVGLGGVGVGLVFAWVAALVALVACVLTFLPSTRPFFAPRPPGGVAGR
jgi:hypothetical protein